MGHLELRPHHLNFIEFALRERQEPSPIWKRKAQWYGSAMVDLIDSIVERVSNNPQTLIKIVKGGDKSICLSGCCPFVDTCLNGDYHEIIDAFRRNGQPWGGRAPDESDDAVLREKGISYGQTYSAKHLFSI